VEPIVVLVVLPIVIGVLSELVFRATTHASLAAAIGTTVAVFVSLRFLASEGPWTWFAALLVTPLAIASALAAVILVYGRSHARRRRGRHDA
jgi:Na+-driven multidrug efflux pump